MKGGFITVHVYIILFSTTARTPGPPTETIRRISLSIYVYCLDISQFMYVHA